MSELTLTPERTALIAIDLMERIVAQPTAPHSGADVLARSVRLADALREAGGTVVWVRVERPNVDEQPPGSGLCPEIEVAASDIVTVKRTWGAFRGTGLEDALRERGVDTVLLTGLVTNFGVESTGRDAEEAGFRTVFVEDAMSGLDAHAHEFAVDYVFRRLGPVASTKEALAAVTCSIAR
ncbi:isochorismatase family protein [Actinomadura logoneensis]|uniref:Isochorismatase family protein n=1 Tax=Actinomadura logoneensis TaxID=2293572 RepID=A0A372JNU8_9ACTN|nr:isochorismatase family protein [Actinomadura logoneensis]RFU41424.1 isochorismatase family protein [Actinomadura logoneensis]